ncbi:MAG: 16S rRNA (adenine(1518)-N(6)/adenine(1519)-N(6))-dimethyltransferase RsmA [Patescibacteria group bacterium]|nr:16S rRNA (adenine(1518)-N(6)/adenine(1519)-N(6))-dimethyltransferase RsmA [Patescibacteria group bacterium]
MSDVPFAKKSLGQHWLQDAAALEAMCESAEVQMDDVVLEIGPGFGTLTRHLLDWEADVIALEFDETLIPALRQKFARDADAGHFRVEQGDIRSYDFSVLPAGYKVVANIPYYLTSNLIQLLSETPNPPSVAALLVQKEVAERVAAAAGDMSILSVTAQFYWDVTLGIKVPAKLFSPPPKVDSQILILQRRADLLMPEADVKAFFRLVKAGFSQRRKTLLNSLSGGLRLEKTVVQALCAAANIEPGRRAQTLTMTEWRDLFKHYVATTPSA